jgi:hypothetical protein
LKSDARSRCGDINARLKIGRDSEVFFNTILSKKNKAVEIIALKRKNPTIYLLKILIICLG